MTSATTENRGKIVILKAGDPETGFMDELGLEALHKEFRRAEASEETRAIIITGAAEGAFVQHFRLPEIEKTSRKLIERGASYGEDSYVGERTMDLLFHRFAASRLPIIAAMNGNAQGIGLELALACDYRIALDGDYLIGFPEIRLGTLPGAGGTQRLTRLIGTGPGMEMILFGEPVSPREALALRIVHSLSADDVLGSALARAEQLAGMPPLAVAYCKRLVHAAGSLSLREGLDLERRLFMDLLTREDALARVAALNRAGKDLRDIDAFF